MYEYIYIYIYIYISILLFTHINRMEDFGQRGFSGVDLGPLQPMWTALAPTLGLTAPCLVSLASEL